MNTKKATAKVMKLIDPGTGKMECRVCGAVHWAMLRGGGHYYRGSWQCDQGCKLPESQARGLQHQKQDDDPPPPRAA